MSLFFKGQLFNQNNNIDFKSDTLSNPTGTFSDLLDLNSDNNFQIAVKQNASTSTTATTCGNWEPMVAWRTMNTYAGVDVDIDKPNVKFFGGSSNNLVWSEQIAWKSDIDKLEQEIANLKKQIGGVISHLTHVYQCFKPLFNFRKVAF